MSDTTTSACLPRSSCSSFRSTSSSVKSPWIKTTPSPVWPLSAPAQAARLTPLAALVRLREGPLATPDARPATVRVVTDTGSVYEVAVPHSLGDRDHSPFDAATHHDLLAAALTSAGPAPFGPDLVVDVVAARPTAASAATELARLRLAEPERKP